MHLFNLRVYYEDTDLAGIVYYANYLKFIERARSEWVRDLGIDQAQMKAEGLVFAVRRVVADYLLPARYDDLLCVETKLLPGTAATVSNTTARCPYLFLKKVSATNLKNLVNPNAMRSLIFSGLW